MSATGSYLVKSANKASSTSLSKLVPSDLACKENCYRLAMKVAVDLSEEERNSCWDLFALNMEDFYKSSHIGWTPEAKKKELFHRLSRFILVHGAGGKLAAFVMFRFEFEDGSNLLYCYELQVSPDCKRQGLGRGLMDLLKTIASKYAMDKVMLTVFKLNSQAVGFYTEYGFMSDPSCPGYEQDDPSTDYRILSVKV